MGKGAVRVPGNNERPPSRLDSPRHPADPATGQAAAAAGQSALVSVIVPCCGQLEYTRICLPSLLRHCRRPYELIFADVGSMDGTSEYLAGVADAAPVRVEVISSPAESGFRAACTEARVRARGEFNVWLNNDTIVTDGWLQQLVGLAGVIDEVVGMVGPMSNYAPTQQLVAPVPYRIRAKRDGQSMHAGAAGEYAVDIDALDRFAREWREQHRRQWFEVERLGGFCLLINPAVLRKVDFFDERSAPGAFDAEALSRKVRQAGHHCLVCRDLFIHHFGNRVASA